MVKIRVLLAEDHALMREGTRELVQHEPGIEIVGEAGDGEEAVQLASELQPDVVIMDIRMPKLNGIAATKQIKELYPDIAVLILTAYDDDQYVFGLIEAGAAGYLLKDVSSQELVSAIRTVCAGGSVLHPAITRKVLERLIAISSGKLDVERIAKPLGEREMAVLRLAAKGMSNKDIAEELSLSVPTVYNYLRNIFNKLGVSSRPEAVQYAVKEGWVNLQ